MYGDPDISSVPESLLPLVEASLAKDPQSRPTARQLLDRLTSASSRPENVDDTPTQVILARTWQSGSHTVPSPASRPTEANQAPARQPAASALWPDVVPSAAAPSAAAPSAAAPSATAPSAAERPTAEPPTADQPAPALSSGAAPAAAAAAPEKITVGRRMATMATSALAAMRLRRPSRQEEPKR
jgi:serine/threonine protein kinase